MAATDRIATAQLMLVKLGLDGDNPAWSGALHERLLRCVMEAPGGTVADLLAAMCGVVRDYQPALSAPVAALIKELVIKCYTRHRSDYEAVDWKALAECISENASQAQLYFALHAFPPEFVTPQLADAIAKGLEFTPFREEAASALAVG